MSISGSDRVEYGDRENESEMEASKRDSHR